MNMAEQSQQIGEAGTATGVSVFVPSYNHARFVETCLRSIMRQTLPPAKLLVIDDGSTDNSPAIIERVLADCRFPCEFIVRKNRGLCATLNEGLARTSQPYFAYLGSDDVWLPEFLESRVALLESRPRAVLGYGHCYLVDEWGQVIDSTSDWAVYADGDAREMLLRTIAPMSPTVMYRRSALERHGWREGSRLEDYDLYLRLCVEGEFAFDPRVLAAWRQHGHNTSHNQTMMLEEKLAAQKRAAQSLGLSVSELERHAKRVRFFSAEDFLRYGDKAAALRLMWSNLSGAASLSSTARMLLRLCVPFHLIRWRKKRLHRRNADRYGTIQI